MAIGRSASHLKCMIEPIAYFGLVDDEDLELAAAALELAALDHPDLDLDPYAAQLFAMAERLAEVGQDAHTSAQMASALARVIGEEYGFAGDRDTYDDPRNADMICVIDRRRGLPVSLAILYVAAARRVGWVAEALNTPGHVLVRVGADTAPVLIDPFNGGRQVAPEQLAELVAQAIGADTKVLPDHVAAMSNRAVLTRLLVNMATRAQARGDAARARVLYARINAFAPMDANAWWQGARLALAAGEVDEARASLMALLEITRDPRLRDQVHEILQRIAAAG